MALHVTAKAWSCYIIIPDLIFLRAGLPVQLAEKMCVIVITITKQYSFINTSSSPPKDTENKQTNKHKHDQFGCLPHLMALSPQYRINHHVKVFFGETDLEILKVFFLLGYSL